MSTVKIKRSGTTSSTPSSLDHGELAINYADATLFWKDSSNVIKSFVFQSYASATHASSHATGGSDALTPADIGAAPAASPAITGNATFSASSGVPVTITNTGSGNSFVVNDEASDASPFVVGSSGLVGIGVEPTSRRLTVRGASTGDGAVLLQSSSTGTGTSNGFIIQCFGASSDAYVWNFENAPIIFGANNAERMRLTSAGDLGLGPSRTAPASRLDVNGVITVAATSGSAGSYAPSLTFSGDANTGFGQVSGQSDTASIFTAGSERVRVDSSGNIEAGPNKRTIGVSSRMHISADNANWGTPLCVVCDSVGRGPVVVSADYSPNPDVGSQLYINASTGGFTIGCSSPGNSALGSVTFSASQIVTPAGSAAAPALVASGDANTGAFFPAADTFAISTAGSERVRVDSSGRVGIGTNNPLSSLAVVSGTNTVGVRIGTATATDLHRFTISASGFALYQLKNESNAVTTVISATGSSYFTGGNVGIGTTSPSALLDINADKIRLRTAKTPASASDTGNAGDICWDASYLYICTATNTWRRIAHSTW